MHTSKEVTIAKKTTWVCMDAWKIKWRGNNSAKG